MLRISHKYQIILHTPLTIRNVGISQRLSSFRLEEVDEGDSVLLLCVLSLLQGTACLFVNLFSSFLPVLVELGRPSDCLISRSIPLVNRITYQLIYWLGYQLVSCFLLHLFTELITYLASFWQMFSQLVYSVICSQILVASGFPTWKA